MLTKKKAILIVSEKDFKTRTTLRFRGGECLLIRGKLNRNLYQCWTLLLLITLKNHRIMMEKWQDNKQNYTAKLDRIMVETDRPIIIMAHLYITFPEIDGTRQKISKSTDSWTHMIELHN